MRHKLHASNQVSVRKRAKLIGSCSLLAIFLLIFFVSPTPGLSQNSQTVRLEIQGLTKALEQQVLAYVDEIPAMPLDDIPSYTEKLQKITAKSLQAIGYYQSQISAKHASYKTNSTIALYVDAGTPVRLRTIEINLSSPHGNLDEFNKEVRALGLEKGKTFNHGTYEQAKATLIKTAQFLGYFDATLTRSQVLISKKDNSADVFIDFALGKRYSINQVIYKQDLYAKNFLQRWQTFEATVPYRASYVRELTVNLQNSGYFKKVRVVPDLLLANNHQIPLIVDLEPASENSVGVGLGFATDTGPRLKSNWLRPHTNRHGHVIESNGSVSRLRQELSLSYRVPQYRKPAHNSYSLDIGILNKKTDDTYSQLRTLEASEHRITKNNWRREVFLRIENERFDVGDTKDKINLLLPGIGFSRVKSSGGIHPDKGQFLSFQVMAARRDFFSDINMSRINAAAKFLTSWDRKHYLITRAELGALNTDSFTRVPTTHRFFAGGDSSVRGYSYQQISPKNDDDEATGGQFLTTGSVEYNRYFTEKFAIAAFVDAGRAFNDSADPTRIGVGFGFRWRSPVGPLRIDLAHGIDDSDSPYRVHFTIGPEL